MFLFFRQIQGLQLYFTGNIDVIIASCYLVCFSDRKTRLAAYQQYFVKIRLDVRDENIFFKCQQSGLFFCYVCNLNR